MEDYIITGETPQAAPIILGFAEKVYTDFSDVVGLMGSDPTDAAAKLNIGEVGKLVGIYDESPVVRLSGVIWLQFAKT